MSGPQELNGHWPQSHGMQDQGTNQYRVPTVNEALPYSPFASIVPFDPGLIPPPLVSPRAAPTAFGHAHDVQKAHKDLERLSAGAQSAEKASHRCQKLMQDVRDLLHANTVTEYKFTRPAIRTRSSDKKEVTKALPSPQLSSFGKMVYDNTNISYRCVSPEADRTGIENTIEVRTPSKAGSSQKAVKVEIPVYRAGPGQSEFVNPQHVSSTPKNQVFVLPTTLTPAQRAEYQYIPGKDSGHENHTDGFHLSQRASLTNGATPNDQRRKADAAVENLQSLLFAIFEAEDQMQPDTSGMVSSRSGEFFTLHDTDNGTVSILYPEIQLKLDAAVHKVCAAKRLDEIETAYLVRVQQLCENAVTVGQIGSLEIDSDWNEQDESEWLTRVVSSNNGLTAARTLIAIMAEKSHAKELQSEDSTTTVLNALRTVTETCIVPVVEERSILGEKIKGEKEITVNPRFAIAAEHSKTLQGLVHSARKALRTLGDLLMQSELDESSLSSVEYLCKMLLFAENAPSEKESALGMQTFETMRKAAMDVLCKVYTKYTGQRDFILQEVLMSLEKLPATKQSARQYRLADAKPIQLVSALLMRLVQTSATVTKKALQIQDESKTAGDEDKSLASDESDDDADADADYDEDEDAIGPTRKGSKPVPKAQQSKLALAIDPLQQSAKHSANYIIGMLLQRALATTKSSEEPFRKLLDIFTDDFLNVFGSSDWPSAEILLRTLVIHLIGMAENPKSPAPSRTLALELLGTIGSGILDTQAATRDAANAIEAEDAISERLVHLVAHFEDDASIGAIFTAFNGPYRVVFEYLQARGENDTQLQSACGYHLMQWAQLLVRSQETPEAKATMESNSEMQHKVLSLLNDPQWSPEHDHFATPSTAQGRLAAKIVASKSLLSRAFNRIFNVVLSAMSSEQPTIRSRGLKSVYTLLEKDPSVLDRNAQVLNQIFRCLGDSSSLVRDSALALIEKCVLLRPQLELTVYERVIARTHDTAVIVRKRALKFLKQIYLHREVNAIRTAIATAVILRVQDQEQSVADIARDTMEDIFFSPLRGSENQVGQNVEALLRSRSHAALFINIVDLGVEMTAVLEPLMKRMLVQSKQAEENVRVCKAMVEILFDGIIDNTDIPGAPSQSAILSALTVFAKAGPLLFTASQLERLEPYTKNLTDSDDLDVYRHATTILHYTMPCLTSGLGQKFLENLQTALLVSVNAIPKSELAVVAPCLWEIDKALKNTERLVKFVISAVAGVYNHREQNLAESPQALKRASKLLTIVGQFGKACNFQPQLAAFKARFEWYRGGTVAGLLVDVICRFTSPKQPLSIRESAIEAVCSVCQTWPEHFLRSDVVDAIETIFRDKISSLEYILLVNLEVFFAAQEAQSEDDSTLQLGTGIESGSQRLGGTYKATEDDKASTAISQRFLPEFLRLALCSFDETAMSAARIVVSINRQGRAHPRESGPGLIALETCPNQLIAKMAFTEHKSQYAKHESVYEKELIRGIQQAFDYQRRVAEDTRGFTGQPPVSKLHLFWDVMKSGKAKVRTKFFTNLCAKMDFDPARLESFNHATPTHLLFVRFCLEAIAFLDFDRIEELLHLLSSLEKTFAGTGTAVAQAIESEVLKIQVPVMLSSESMINGSYPSSYMTAIDPNRLHQLAVSAQILSLFWETRSFLRRLWNMQKHLSRPKNAGAAKETNRAPTRSSNSVALIESHLSRVGEVMNVAVDEGAQQQVCRAFVDLISVDSEIKVMDHEDDSVDLENGFEDRSQASLSKSPTPGPRGKKRKSFGSPTNAARKKGKPRRSSSMREFDDDDDDEGGWD